MSSPLSLRYIDDLSIRDSKFKTENAIDFVLNKSKLYKVIIINEAHNKPWHRDFTNLLISRFGQEFKIFASETLIDPKKQIYNSKFPRLIKGYTFINEPRYAELVRTALKKGMYVVGYDSYNDSMFELIKSSDTSFIFKSKLDAFKLAINATEYNASFNPKRELIQAYNLFKIIQKNSKYKVVIHSGYSHNSREMGFMAYFLKKLGVNFLTVNQTFFNPHYTDSFYFKPYKDNLKFDQPYVFVNDKNESVSYNKLIEAGGDVFVNHSDPFALKNRINQIKLTKVDVIQIDSFIDKQNLPNKFLIYYKEEFDALGCEAIPLEVFEVSDKNMLAKISLNRRYKYVMIRRNRNNQNFKKEIWMD